jgi:hypothetical protein
MTGGSFALAAVNQIENDHNFIDEKIVPKYKKVVAQQ